MTTRYLRPRFLIGLTIVMGLGFLEASNLTRGPERSTGETRWGDEIPHWMQSSACVPPDDLDRHEVDLVLEVLKTIKNGHGRGMPRAAFNYFGTTEMRKEGTGYVRICPNDIALAQFARLTSGTMFWRVGGFGGDHDIEHLQVARNVGPRLPEVVSIVAETAFAENPIIDKSLRTESLERDVRPLARIILAEFGMAATPWSEQAFAAMGSGDKLGTTAAQIAVVTHHPGALEKTAALLEGILKDHPRDPMPDYVWMRFYELAFALAAAGSEAKPVIDPVIRMTCRTIAVWAPPFGWLTVPPDEMSSVVKKVGADPCRTPASPTNARP